MDRNAAERRPMYRIEPRIELDLPTIVSDIGVVIEERTVDRDGESGPGRDVRVENGGSTIVYTSERNAVFEIQDGKRIKVDPASVASEEEIRLNLLGPLLRLVLLQRGEFVLHASVVRIDARTAAFIAASGHGKSTTAAGLYARGHGVLSDDTAIVRLRSEPGVLAGPAVLKLHGETAARIDRAIEPIFSEGLEFEKRFYRLEEEGTPNETTLDTVYFLEHGDAIEIEPVFDRDATVEFVDNSWGLPDAGDEVAAGTLRRCSKLARAVSVRRIRYPRSFGAFDEVLDRIEADCTREH